MKELHELIRDLREDHNSKQEEAADYYCDITYLGNITDHDAMCDIQKLKPQGNKGLGRYLRYLESVEEYEITRRQSKE